MNAVIPNNRAKASNPSFAIVDRTLTMTGFASATKPGISLDKTFAAFRILIHPINPLKGRLSVFLLSR